MIKFYVILIVFTIQSIKTVSSIDCYQCLSENGKPKECDQGLDYNIDRGPCKPAGEKWHCYKIVGNGKNNVDHQIIARGCIKENEIKPKNYTREEPFKREEYEIVGQMFTCETNLCNSSNRLTESLTLLATFIGFRLFFNFKSRFNLELI